MLELLSMLMNLRSPDIFKMAQSLPLRYITFPYLVLLSHQKQINQAVVLYS